MAEAKAQAEPEKKARSLVLVERLIEVLHDRGAINDREYSIITRP